MIQVVAVKTHFRVNESANYIRLSSIVNNEILLLTVSIFPAHPCFLNFFICLPLEGKLTVSLDTNRLLVIYL